MAGPRHTNLLHRQGLERGQQLAHAWAGGSYAVAAQNSQVAAELRHSLPVADNWHFHQALAGVACSSADWGVVRTHLVGAALQIRAVAVHNPVVAHSQTQDQSVDRAEPAVDRNPATENREAAAPAAERPARFAVEKAASEGVAEKPAQPAACRHPVVDGRATFVAARAEAAASPRGQDLAVAGAAAL